VVDFDGKVVIVTGGALGMGRSTADEFAKSGASVVVADIDREAGERNVRHMRDEGSSGLFVRADVSDAGDSKRVVEEAVAAFGGVDILFNNAGIQPPDSYLNVEDTSEETWDRITGVNLKAHFLMSKYTIPEMRKRGGGVIINNASAKAYSRSLWFRLTPPAKEACCR
jgi:NAD(P)-dependent dehydrogenase (short-subunit alcohol dehydrogenase family)